jgi:lipopolysaccharide export system protein LptC
MNRNSIEARRDRHTRRVRVLKVGLPLVALAIMSSLFLFSSSITLDGALPFADVDVADRLREPKMTQVQIATTGASGAVIDINAATITPIGETQAKATTAFGTITALSGHVTQMQAAQIDYDEGAAAAALTGGVKVQASGYQMVTDALDVDIANAQADSRSTVNAIGPLGTLDAGRMSIRQNQTGVVVVFKSGVRLLYTPK